MNKFRENSIVFEGRTHISNFKSALLNLFTFGLSNLLCRLSVRIEIFLNTSPCSLDTANCAVLWDQYGNKQILKIKQLKVKRSLALKRYTKNSVVRVLNSPYGRFIYDFLLDKFVLPNYTWSQKSFEEIYKQIISTGKETEASNLYEKQVIFGKNSNGLVIESTFEIIVNNIVEPFFIWEAASFVTWIAIRYYKYAMVVGSIYLVMLISNIIEDIRKNNIVKQSAKVKTIRTMRDGRFVAIKETELLPGDLIYIDRTESFSCDAEILKGNVISDESFLTGESVPICKGIGSMVYSGTKVVKSNSAKITFADPHMEKLIRINRLTNPSAEVKPEKVKSKQFVDECAVGMVMRTGKRTKRSALLTSLSIRKPITNEFTRQSLRVTRYLIAGATVLMLLFICYFSRTLSLKVNLEYSTDVALTFFSPALYTCLQMGIQNARKELQKKSINTTDTSRINTAGEVSLIIFDKTGTLTELGVDILCFDTIQEIQEDIKDLSLDARMALSTCHHVVELDDQYSGDVLDMKMFLYSESKIITRNNRRYIEMDIERSYKPTYKEYTDKEEDYTVFFNADGSPGVECSEDTLEVLKIYDFDMYLKRLSVVVRDNSGNNYLFCKGAPDAIETILSEMPAGYHEKVKQYGLEGYRVLAVGKKPISTYGNRDEDERGLVFLGFIVFANKLKPETADVIRELREGNLHPKMCTGDNILTSISVARECGMIDAGMPILFPVLDEGCKSCYDVEWYSIADEDFVFDKLRMVLHTEPDNEIFYDFIVACEAKEFRYFRGTCYEKLILEKGVIFARFNPDNKKELIEEYAQTGLVTMFCGDGANDTGALSSADVGLSLATNEASLAASFNSKNLTAVLDVIKEGRSAISMSAAQFKYVFYSQTLAGFQIVSLFFYGLFPADGMSLVNDLLSCYVLGFSLCKFTASDRICSEKFVCLISKDCLSIFLELSVVFFIYLVSGFFVNEPSVVGSISPVSKKSTIFYFSTLMLLIIKAVVFADFGAYRSKRLDSPKFLAIIFFALVLFFVILVSFLYEFRWAMDFFCFTELSDNEIRLLFICLICTVFVSIFPFQKLARCRNVGE